MSIGAPDGQHAWVLPGVLVIDSVAREVVLPDRWVPLTPREHAILACLARNFRRAVSRDLLAHAVGAPTAATTRAIDLVIHKLRAKLGDAAVHLETVRGVG